MKKIKISTDLGPFLDNKPLPMGAEAEVEDAIAEAFVAKGFAEIVKRPAGKRAEEPQLDV